MKLSKNIFASGGRKSVRRAGLLAISAAAGAVLAGGLTAKADVNGFSAFAPINTEGAASGNANIGYKSSNTAFELTDGQNGEGTSGWALTPQSIANGFTATYTYQTVPQYTYANPNGSLEADGVALAFQNPLTGSTSALGGGGGGLGYANGGVTSNSAAIGYELFNGYYSYQGGSELLTNGNQGALNDLTNGVDISTGDAMSVTVSYAGTTLTQTTIDNTTGASSTQVYTGVNLGSTVQSAKSIVGFTGGTGGYNATQTVSNFSIVAAPKYAPIAVTGFNQAAIIPANGNTSVVTATMDGGTAMTGNTWYEQGYSTNLPTSGLPASGSTFTSQQDNNHVFQMQSYSGNDVVLLNSTSTSDTLALTTPTAYDALSFLTSSGNGPSTFTATINYQNGSSSPAAFVASPDWFSGQPSAWSAGGRTTLTNGTTTEDDGQNPNIYEEDLTVPDPTDPISSISLNYAAGGNIMIFGVSGFATAPQPVLIYTGNQVPGAFDSSSVNWVNDTTATNFSNGQLVQFDDTSANTTQNRTITVAAGTSPAGITFANTTATLPYTFQGAGIQGSGGVTLTGSGTVFLDNPNTYSGNTEIDAGTLVVGTGGTVAGNNILVYLGGTLNVAGGALTGSAINLQLYGGTALYSPASLSVASLNGTGPLTSTNPSGTSLTVTGSSTYSGQASLGTGSVTINANGSTVTLTGSNTYSGGTLLQAGTLLIGNAAVGSGPVNLSGGVIGAASASVNLTNQVVGGALIAASGNNLLELSNTANSFTGPIVVQSGTLQVDSPTVIGSTTTIDVASGASFLVNDTSGNAGLGTTMTISGTGVTTSGPTGALRGADIASANDVWAGNVVVSGPSYISAGASAQLSLTGSITGNGPVVFTESPIINGGGTLILLAPSAGNSNTYTGESQILPGPVAAGYDAVQLGANNGFSPNSGLNVLGGLAQPLQVDLNGYNQTLVYLTGVSEPGFVLTSTGGPSTLTVTSGLNAGQPSTFATAITGNVSVVMNDPTGTGNQIFAGSNTYSGGTTIVKGTLSAASSTALGTGQVNLSGGTLALAGVTGALGNSSLNQFTLNQGAGPGGTSLASVSNGTLTLTNNGINGVANSAFYPQKVLVSDKSGFTVSFVYNVTAGYADGMAFVLQNDPRGAAAVSSGGGSDLGYGGANAIANSAAVEFEIYPFGSSGNGTAFESEGNIATTYNNTSPVNIALEDIGGNYYYDFQPIDVTLAYNGIAQTLTETLYSETEQQTFSITYPGVDYSQLLGGPAGGTTSAYIGFTAATGGVSSTQQIYNFSYNPGAAGPPQSISNNIVATAGTSSAIQLGVQAGALDSGATVGSITVQTGATLALTNSTAGSRGVLVTPSISIASAGGSFTGQLDVGYNDLDIQASGGMTLAQVTAMVAGGYNNGKWNGNGIASSAAAADTTHLTALGVIVNDNGSGTPLYGNGGTIASTFDGTILAADGDILVKLTYYGDANLDGTVDASDYSRIDNGYLNHLTGWSNGDFNYDGVVNGSDYTLIDNAYNMQGASNPLAEDAGSTAQIAGGAGTSAVPEPASLGLLALGAAGLLGKRRRRQ